MTQVTTAQKLFEKFLMLARLDEKDLAIMVASDEDNNAYLIVGANNQNGNFTPLAKLLSHRMISMLTPDYDRSQKVRELFKEGAQLESGKFPHDFMSGKVNPLFTAEQIEKLDI